MGHARALLGTPDRAFQEQLAKRAVAEDLSVREVEEAIREPRGHADGSTRGAEPRAAPKLRPPGLLELEELLGDYLETRVRITMGPRRGQGRGRVRDPRGPRADLPGDDRRAASRADEPDGARLRRSSDVDRFFDAAADPVDERARDARAARA